MSRGGGARTRIWRWVIQEAFIHTEDVEDLRESERKESNGIEGVVLEGKLDVE